MNLLLDSVLVQIKEEKEYATHVTAKAVPFIPLKVDNEALLHTFLDSVPLLLDLHKSSILS